MDEKNSEHSCFNSRLNLTPTERPTHIPTKAVREGKTTISIYFQIFHEGEVPLPQEKKPSVPAIIMVTDQFL